MNKKRILLTNDDGVFSEGIQALINVFKGSVDLTVVAPDRERSAIGHSLTFFYPLRVQKLEESKNLKIYSSDGTPSDCVLLGIYDLMPEAPDLIISGINHGPNMGQDITYSGTVSAAMEGTIHKIPSVSVSLASFINMNFTYAAKFVKKLSDCAIEKDLPALSFFNVNIPNLPEDEIKGSAFTKQGRSIYDQKLIKRMDPRGIEYYWLSGEFPTGLIEKGTDFEAVYKDKKISITPVQLDMTNFDLLSRLKDRKL
ncbi:MAG: 5'/3'-nucleotidase SurE [Armatimonadota bacterium]